MSRYGASLRSSGKSTPASRHSRAKRSRLLRVEGERHRARVLDTERAGVVERAQRRTVHAGEQHPDGEPLRRPPFGHARGRDGRDVGDDDARLGEQAQLDAERRPAGCREERRPAELLRHDDRHEGVVAARQAPHLLEQPVGAPSPERQLEPRLVAREVPPAGADAGVRVAPRDVQRAQATRRARSGGRTRARPRSRRRSSRPRRVRRSSGCPPHCTAPRRRPQPPREPPVVTVDARGTSATRSGIATITSHAPSLNFVQIDDQRHEPGRGRADGVDQRAVTPAGVVRPQPVPHHSRPARA